jgi:hypothetical protein
LPFWECVEIPLVLTYLSAHSLVGELVGQGFS